MHTLLTFVLTVLGGTLVFVLGQLILKMVLEPSADLSKIMAEIKTAVIFYGNVESCIGDENLKAEARREFRKLASAIRYKADTIYLYSFVRSDCFYGFPEKNDLSTLSCLLIGVSNSIFDPPDNRNEKLDEICKLLGMNK